MFPGVEPLVRDDMEEIISAVDDRGTTFLVTNGARLSGERAWALKEAGLFILAASVDSPCPEVDRALAREVPGVLGLRPPTPATVATIYLTSSTAAPVAGSVLRWRVPT